MRSKRINSVTESRKDLKVKGAAEDASANDLSKRAYPVPDWDDKDYLLDDGLASSHGN